ncbi:ThiF family adenylyltransferase [Neptunomonas marina]|uniref:ThiF family adenylyltransferase n=1 Tax=Neptunomonas marina TaxID=1815562 RepID=A0A437Q8Q6_9GAMM|nr:ThiF family adenylyltransferase [Neptunomonas marina]RVU30723.1 ThiF family adenylyltransferase [Neptunomonas marina]
MYNYEASISRNIGWVTHEEQQTLRSKKVAIAGLGGVGGAHLLTLSRLGIANFSISDFDEFEVHNFNRQAGAFVSTLNEPKLDVMQRMALDVNPEAKIETFPEGINETNIDAFLDGVDLYVDSLDFFALDARKLVFKKCKEKGIPAITAAPLGMGCSFLAFLPGHMSFEDYFKLEGYTTEEQLVRFLIGLSPAMLQVKYLVDKSAADFKAQKGPSTPMSVDMCAGIAGTNALKILLGRGEVITAPHGLHFDAYRNKLSKTWRPGGNNHPLQQVAFKVAKKLLL